MEARSWVVVVLYSLLLAAVFVGMITVLVRTVQGAQGVAIGAQGVAVAVGAADTGLVQASAVAAAQVPVLMVLAPAALLLLTLALGVHIAGFLDAAPGRAVQLLGA